TALQNQNGEDNFKTFRLKLHTGSDDPDPIKLALSGGQSSNSAVNLLLETNVPVVRQTTSGDINFIDVRLAVQRLMNSNNNGVFTTSVQLRIEYKPLSSSTWTKAYNQDL